jgi:hypothetical protein
MLRSRQYRRECVYGVADRNFNGLWRRAGNRLRAYLNIYPAANSPRKFMMEDTIAKGRWFRACFRVVVRQERTVARTSERLKKESFLFADTARQCKQSLQKRIRHRSFL